MRASRPYGSSVRRALAAALAIALLSAFVRVAPAVASPDETSVRAAEHPGQPGEPPSDSPSKLTAELVMIHPIVVSAPPSGEVHKPACRVGRGELHAPQHERPPRAAFLHS